jgi:DNA-binding IclR family transcriptional regulator
MSSLGVQVPVVYIACVEPQQDQMSSFRAGRKAPLYCTSSGRLFLAHLSDQELPTYREGSRPRAHPSFTRTSARQSLSDIRAPRASFGSASASLRSTDRSDRAEATRLVPQAVRRTRSK